MISLNTYKTYDDNMEYIIKRCPICGKPFTVAERVAHKELYCTMSCYSQAHVKQEKNTCIPHNI